MATHIHKKIVSDERHQPVAVLIDYQDWLKIEKLLNITQDSSQDSLATVFEEIRQLCQEENYLLEVPDRWNRKNTFEYADE
jgi:Fe2+ or Zn2+ uptake regulation protein